MQNQRLTRRHHRRRRRAMSEARRCDSLIGGIYQRRATICALRACRCFCHRVSAARGICIPVTNASLRPAERRVGRSHVWQRSERSDSGCWGDGKDKDVWSGMFTGIRGVVTDK